MYKNLYSQLIDRLCGLNQKNIVQYNSISISKKAIHKNYNFLKTLHPSLSIFPVLKSQAYGHGYIQMIIILNDLPLNFVCINSIDELFLVKKHSNHTPLLLSHTALENYAYCTNTSVVVYSLTYLKKLLQMKHINEIHLFFDTGMKREGFSYKDIDAIKALCKQYQCSHKITGIVTHLIESESSDQTITQTQYDLFDTIQKKLQTTFKNIQRIHSANSGGILLYKDQKNCTAVRSGLSLYGIFPGYIDHPQANFFMKKLNPACEVWSQITHKHTIKKGEGVSYNHTRKSQEDGLIYIIPFGYREGIPRLSSNKIYFKVQNTYVQQVGNVCMNFTLFFSKTNFSLGEKVQIVSSNANDKNSLYALSHASGKIPYEVLVGFHDSIQRTII